MSSYVEIEINGKEYGVTFDFYRGCEEEGTRDEYDIISVEGLNGKPIIYTDDEIIKRLEDERENDIY